MLFSNNEHLVQTWHKVSMGEGDSGVFFQIKGPLKGGDNLELLKILLVFIKHLFSSPEPKV